jgi:hypothetical protein
MKNFNSQKVKKLPILWKQAIAQRKQRGINLKTFIMHYLLFINSFRNHQSLLLDYLILGSNPILNLIKLVEIIKNQKTKKPIIIGILNSNDLDYWGYHAFEKEDVWNLLKKDYSLSYQDINDFFSQSIDSLYIDEHIKLVFINDFNFSFNDLRYDNYMNGYILNLVDKKEENFDLFNTMKSIVRAENNIKSKFLHIFKNSFKQKQTVLDNIFECSFPDKKEFSKASNISSHIICTKEIYISSINCFLNPTLKEDTITLFNEDIDITILQHQFFNISNGSAKKISNSFIGLEYIAIQDFIMANK